MKYRITFSATIERIIDVPEDFSWSDAYDFAQNQLGWYDLAHSAAATMAINTDRVASFALLKPPKPDPEEAPF